MVSTIPATPKPKARKFSEPQRNVHLEEGERHVLMKTARTKRLKLMFHYSLLSRCVFRNFEFWLFNLIRLYSANGPN